MNSKRTVKWAVGLAVVLSAAYMVATVVQPGAGVGASPNDTPLKGLPDDATEISYCLATGLRPNSCYEFRTTEEHFRLWVAQRKRPSMGEIRAGEVRIVRYSPEFRRFEQKVIVNGLVSSWSQEDRGTRMAYDMDEGKAYFHDHSR